MFWTGLTKYRDLGLLIIRVGVGLSFVLLHGWPKWQGGTDLWVKLGGSMGNLGITFAPTFWGFMAMFAELVGGICLIVGLFFRPALLLLIITMGMAVTHHRMGGDSWAQASHALEIGLVFLGLFFVGPGKYSIDRQ